MKVYSIHDERFKKYGFVLTGYDYTELFENLKKVPMPDERIDYVAYLESLENCAAAKEMEIRGFGAMPVHMLHDAEDNKDFTLRLALMDEFKCLPSNAVWEYYCMTKGIPTNEQWLTDLRQYEKDVMFKR